MVPILPLIGVFFIVTPLFFAGHILHKIDKQAKKVQAPVRIWLVDLFSLTFLIQLPLAIVTIDGVPMSLAVFLTLLFTGIMTLVWWTTVQTVSRAGFNRIGWRSAISLVVIPTTYLGSFAMIGISSQLLSATFDRSALWYLSGEAVLLLLMLFSRYIVIRAIANSIHTQPKNSQASRV